jgi:Tol biopolymer transport system component
MEEGSAVRATAPGVAGTTAATDGLPLVPTRTIAFETDQGTWLSVDVAPDGRTLVFDLLGDLYLLDSAGGHARRLTSGMAFDSQPVWSPDGAQIAYLSDRSGAENLWVMSADGSAPRQVTGNDGPDELVSPAWARDGAALYVSLYRADRNAVELWRHDLAGGRRDALSARGANALGAAPSPDGRHVYYAMRSGPVFEDDVRLPLWSIQRRDLASQRVETVVTNVGSAMRPVLSPDGRLLAYAVRRDGATALRLRDLATGADRELLNPIQHDAQEAVPTRDLLPGYGFTPDGREIVLTRAGGLVRVSTETGATRPIPFRAQVQLELGRLLRQDLRQESGAVRARLIEEPRQSPDATRLAFSALGRIYVMDLQPGAQPQRLTRDDHGPPEFHPSWSPDGRSLAYVTWTLAEGGAIWIAEASPSRPARRLTRNDAFFYSDVAFVPEGGSIMALRSSAEERRRTIQEPMWTGRSGGFLRQAELVEMALDGGAARVVTSGPMDGAAQFTRERDRVYLHTDAGLEAIARDGSWRKPALELVGPPYYFKDEPAPASDIKVSPDGRYALVLFAQQAYLVAMPPTDAPGAADAPIDLTRADAPARRLTTVGADSSSWSRDGAAVAWSVGATFCRAPLAAVLQLPPSAPSAAAARTTLQPATKCFDAAVERPRDTPAEAASWVLRGATLVTMRGDEVIADADLLVRGNRIAALGPRGQVAVPGDARVVDASGRFVVPGLIDAHMHVGGIRRNVLQLDDWSLRATLAFGVTTVLDPSSLSVDMFAYGDLIDAGLVTGPRLYTTGTAMFSFNRLQSLDDARDLLRRYRDFYRTRNVKQYRIGSRRARQWIAIAAHELGMMPTTEGAVDMKLGLTQVLDGFAGNEHAFGVFPLYRDVVELMARSGTSTVLTLMISHGGPPAGPDFIARTGALSDPAVTRWFPQNVRDKWFARAPWVAPRDYVYGAMAADAAAIQQAGGVVGIGSHGNYPGAGTHWEMQAHAAGGMRPHAVLRAATLGSAATIGRQAELGSLEPGKLADFIVLEANPLEDVANALRIDRVVKDGRVYDGATVASAPLATR